MRLGLGYLGADGQRGWVVAVGKNDVDIAWPRGVVTVPKGRLRERSSYCPLDDAAMTNLWSCRNCSWTYRGPFPGSHVPEHEHEMGHVVMCPPPR